MNGTSPAKEFWKYKTAVSKGSNVSVSKLFEKFVLHTNTINLQPEAVTSQGGWQITNYDGNLNSTQ